MNPKQISPPPFPFSLPLPAFFAHIPSLTRPNIQCALHFQLLNLLIGVPHEMFASSGSNFPTRSFAAEWVELP